MPKNRGPYFGSLPLSFPLLIYLTIGPSKQLALVYLLPLIWTTIPVSSFLFVWILRNHVTRKIGTFLAVYLFEASFATIVAVLAYLPSLLGREIIGISIATFLIYTGFLAVIVVSRTRENSVELHGNFNPELSDRLKKLLGEGYKNVPDVYTVSGIAKYPSRPTIMGKDKKRMYVDEDTFKGLNQEELDAILLHRFFKGISRASVIYALFGVTIAAIEIDIFIYILVGGFPNLGIFVLPVVGVALLLEIMFMPLILLLPIFWADRRADRNTVSVTGNRQAQVSMINKVQGNGEITPLRHGRIYLLAFHILQREQKKRLSRLIKD